MELEEQTCGTRLLSLVAMVESSVLTSLLMAAAQRTRDGSAAEPLVRRWEHTVAVEVWQRTAMMVRRCLPRPGEVRPDTGWAAVLDEADAILDA